MHTGLKEYIENKKNHAFRRDYPEYKDIAKEYHALGLCPKERMTRRFELLSELETPVLLPDEKICLCAPFGTFRTALRRKNGGKFGVAISSMSAAICQIFPRTTSGLSAQDFLRFAMWQTNMENG